MSDPTPQAPEVSERDRRILSVLDDIGAFTTAQVAGQLPLIGHNRRIHSSWVRRYLLDLQRRGLIEAADDKKPVIWRRTQAGTAVITKPPSASPLP